MSNHKVLGIIGGGQLGSMLCQAASKINIKTKIYCDIADLKLIKKFNNKKIVKGFTTNPSLMKKAGAKNYKDYSKKILSQSKIITISRKAIF